MAGGHQAAPKSEGSSMADPKANGKTTARHTGEDADSISGADASGVAKIVSA